MIASRNDPDVHMTEPPGEVTSPLARAHLDDDSDNDAVMMMVVSRSKQAEGDNDDAAVPQ